jgi:hypothetical protein
MPLKQEASTQGVSAATSPTSVTVGLDLGDRCSHFCVLDADGRQLEQHPNRSSLGGRDCARPKIRTRGSFDERLISRRDHEFPADLALVPGGFRAACPLEPARSGPRGWHVTATRPRLRLCGILRTSVFPEKKWYARVDSNH